MNESLLKQHDEPAPQEDEQDVDGLFASSPYDTKGKMNYSGGLDHPSVLQFDRSQAQVIKQPNTFAEQDGYQVDVYRVEESRPDALLRDAGGAHGDVLVVGDRFRLLDGAFDAVRDERERRSLVDPFLRNGVGDNEGWYA